MRCSLLDGASTSEPRGRCQARRRGRGLTNATGRREGGGAAVDSGEGRRLGVGLTVWRASLSPSTALGRRSRGGDFL
jgi:hypothetical protein